MTPIWIINVEVYASTDSGYKTGFINIVASAEDAIEAEGKVRSMLAKYEWEVLNVEDVSIADADHFYGDDLHELIDDVMQNRDHVRLLTLHTYPLS